MVSNSVLILSSTDFLDTVTTVTVGTVILLIGMLAVFAEPDSTPNGYSWLSVNPADLLTEYTNTNLVQGLSPRLILLLNRSW